MRVNFASVVLVAASAPLLVYETDATSSAWINEFHYDSAGRDGREFVEVFLNNGESPSDYKLEFYNSASGELTFYRSLAGGEVTELSNKMGKLAVVQDLHIGGSRTDAIALINTHSRGEDAVLEFISVDGVCTPAEGKGYTAEGLTSIDIDVTEAGTEDTGLSLQRVDTDVVGTWVGPLANTRGKVNEVAGQLISTTSSASTTMSSTGDRTTHRMPFGLRGSQSVAVV